MIICDKCKTQIPIGLEQEKIFGLDLCGECRKGLDAIILDWERDNVKKW